MTPAVDTYEKLGLFYLGRPWDLAAGAPREGLTLYDSKDLLTHAMCVGMTGSGKTGLCVCLLEEAAIDGVPALVIDPKGDLGNLLLTFPDLAAGDFRPWIDEDAARRKDLSPDEFAASGWCSRPRTRSTSTTRRCPTSAPGFSGAFRPSATRRG